VECKRSGRESGNKTGGILHVATDLEARQLRFGSVRFVPIRIAIDWRRNKAGQSRFKGTAGKMNQSSHENLSPQVLQAVSRQLRKLIQEPLEGIHVVVNEEDISDIQADIQGPEDTPYVGGLFRCKLVLSNDFPNTPPRGFFLTKIFHPNVSNNGDICVNTLKKDWKPTLGMSHIFQIVRCLLIIPFPESALNEVASKLFLESYDDYARRARLMTSIHAGQKCAEQSAASDSSKGASEANRSVSCDGAEKGIQHSDEGKDREEDQVAKRRNTGASVKPTLERKKSDRKKNLKRL